MGAPITAYNRISDYPNTVHSNIYYPDYVVVVDETLISNVDVTAGLSEAGAIIINSTKTPEELRPMLKGYAGKVCAVDAASISMEALGTNLHNTPMLGAVVAVSGLLDRESFLENMETSFKHKFATKPQVVDGNMKALRMSMDEVKIG